MNYILDLVTNRFLITAVSSWMVAQVMKTVIYAIINKKIDISRLFGDGGMPSGHSATVSSLAAIAALTYGLASFEFAVSAVFAIVVCHDAMGVRLETGKQAETINRIVKAFNSFNAEKLPYEKLKEFVGHTPIQVIAGIGVGICNALVMHFLVF